MEGGVEGERKVSCSGSARWIGWKTRWTGWRKVYNGQMAEEMEMSEEFDH